MRLACIIAAGTYKATNLRLSVLQLYCVPTIDYMLSFGVADNIGKSLLDGQALDMQQFGLRIRVAFSGPAYSFPVHRGKGFPLNIDCTDPIRPYLYRHVTAREGHMHLTGPGN